MRTRTKLLLLLAAAGGATALACAWPSMRGGKLVDDNADRLVDAMCEARKLGVKEPSELARVGLRVWLQGEELRAYEQLPAEQWPLAVKVKVEAAHAVAERLLYVLAYRDTCPPDIRGAL